MSCVIISEGEPTELKLKRLILFDPSSKIDQILGFFVVSRVFFMFFQVNSNIMCCFTGEPRNQQAGDVSLNFFIKS